ncbi:MAG: hypothetical protein ACRDYY_08880 [Acidimicrobiales bacterium]
MGPTSDQAATREPWRLHFFQRHDADDPRRSVPALEAFQEWPEKVRAEILAVLDAVAEAPPPAFSGGGKWEAMHGEMSGYYEVRVRGNPAGQLYRVFCLLERQAEDLGGPSIVLVAAMSKRPGKKFSRADYADVKRMGDEFKKRRTVMQ